MSQMQAELHELLVEWVYDRAGRSLTAEVPLTEFSQDHRLSRNDAYDLLAHCIALGFLDNKYSDHDAPVANLTPLGLQWTQSRLERRRDPLQRLTAARSGLLLWLWQRQQSGLASSIVTAFLDTAEAYHEGEQLRPDEIDRAAASLADKGLIKGIRASGRRGPVRAETTSAGDVCIEHFGGDVTAYERDQAAGATNITVYGGNTGNIAANSREVTMTAHTVQGVDMAEVVLLARALRQAAPVLGLAETEATELVETADRMEAEATTDDPDPTRLQRWWNSSRAMLDSPVVGGALANVIAAYGNGVLPGL